MSKFRPLGEGFRCFWPQIRLQHAEFSPGTNSEVIWLQLKGFTKWCPVAFQWPVYSRLKWSVFLTFWFPGQWKAIGQNFGNPFNSNQMTSEFVPGEISACWSRIWGPKPWNPSPRGQNLEIKILKSIRPVALLSFLKGSISPVKPFKGPYCPGR